MDTSSSVVFTNTMPQSSVTNLSINQLLLNTAKKISYILATAAVEKIIENKNEIIISVKKIEVDAINNGFSQLKEALPGNGLINSQVKSYLIGTLDNLENQLPPYLDTFNEQQFENFTKLFQSTINKYLS
jgi:hypothetical protein